MDTLCFFLSCVCYAFVRVCLFMPCGHLLGKGGPLGSRLWYMSLSLSHWYPGSGVVLDCIDSLLTLKYCPPKVKERAYANLVRPKLEYISQIWNSAQKTQVKQIPYHPHNPSNVTETINKLNSPNLEQRGV